MKLVQTSLLSLVILLVAGCTKLPYSESRPILGTEVSITIHDTDIRYNEAELKEILAEAFAEVHRIHDLAEWRELKDLNAYAGYKKTWISEELIDIINASYDIAANTGNAYRPDIGPLVNLWGFKRDLEIVPDRHQIDSVLALMNTTEFFAYDSGMGTLEPEGARLDLGGFAKGHAVDLAVKTLREFGVTAAIVEAGGDLRCFGSKPDKTPWRIAVRHPRKLDSFYTILNLTDIAVATSGDYEQYYEIGGKRYHHILDPSTGYPGFESTSCTVIAKTCGEADAYATALFILGPDYGIESAKLLDIEALILAEEGGIIQAYETKGFAEYEEQRYSDE